MEDFYTELLETITYFYTKSALEGRFKETEQKLIEFTRWDEAWEGSFTMLSQPDLNEYQMMFAANTLKTKMIFDFDNFKNNNPGDAEQFGEQIIKMIKEFLSRENRPSDIVINNLWLSLAFFSIHQDTVPEIDSVLNESIDEISAMFMVLKYLSEETYFSRLVV